MSDSERMYRTAVPFSGFATLEYWHVPGAPFDHLVLRVSDSVAGLLVDRTNRRFLLVEQKRPAMVREDNPNGTIVEATAGRFDVKLGPRALLVKEAFEEAGVVLDEEEVELLNQGIPMALSAGILTERSYLAYVEIQPNALTGTDDQVRGVDGEGEAIVRRWYSFDELDTLTVDCVRVLALVQHLKLRLMMMR